jgi:GNAT superfamily N-acetyltransferase
MPAISYKMANLDNASLCIKIRGLTREKDFPEEDYQRIGISTDPWSAGIQDGSFPGYVACVDGKMIGYCFGDRDIGEIIALAIQPDYEGKGVGKTLLGLVVEGFKRLGFSRLFLSCSNDRMVRSYQFYRHLGWESTGEADYFGDEVLEISIRSD